MTQQAPSLPTSRHFRLETVADGIYAAIASEGGDAHSNAGIVDLGDQTLIFDTLFSPAAANDLRAAAEMLTGRPATYVINSHAHTDHWYGNQVFDPTTPILATHKTREMMLAEQDYLTPYQADPEVLKREIAAMEGRMFTETNPQLRRGLEAQIEMQQTLQRALPELRLRLPNLTFEERIVFQGTERSAEIFCLGSGHTPGDAFLLLPQEHIAFMGDLAFFQSHPLFADGDPFNWIDILQNLASFDLQTVIPGHGPLGTPADLNAQEQYIMALERLVTEVIKRGGSADDAARQPIPAPFDTWTDAWGAVTFTHNMRLLHQRLTSD